MAYSLAKKVSATVPAKAQRIQPIGWLGWRGTIRAPNQPNNSTITRPNSSSPEVASRSEYWGRRKLSRNATPSSSADRPNRDQPSRAAVRLLTSASSQVASFAIDTIGPDRPEIVTDRLIPNQQAANRRRTPCNETALTDTQRQQTPWSEPLSQHCHWSGDGDACVHTAEVTVYKRSAPSVGRWSPALVAMASNTAKAAFTAANAASDRRPFTNTHNELVSDGLPDSTLPAMTRHRHFFIGCAVAWSDRPFRPRLLPRCCPEARRPMPDPAGRVHTPGLSCTYRWWARQGLNL